MSGDRFARTWSDAATVPFWLDGPSAPPLGAPLEGEETADLVIVGAGFTGLWAALQAKEADPTRDVVLLEGERVAFGGSGRNGGFCDASLTHGLANGIKRFPGEIHRIEELAHENFAGIADAVARHRIDCDWITPGFVGVATEPHQLAWIRDGVETSHAFGHDVEVLDRDAVRAVADSPTYLGGFRRHDDSALVDPARLAWGLARVARELGVRIYERSSATALATDGAGVAVTTARGRVRAHRAVLATNAFPPLARAIKRYVIPVYDHVLMTEPLSPEQRAAIGWRDRTGLADMGNRFHYYRTTQDGRILWGGYDAIYHYGNKVSPELENRLKTFNTLARNFFSTFPQLEGLRFSHRWAGAIDTCSRFSVMWGTAAQGRAAYAVGYTGLGVGATRFGARVALELISGEDTELTRMAFVRRKPVPFPPEPLRWTGIQMTRYALARADRRQGRRGLWLKSLDAVGLGFDS